MQPGGAPRRAAKNGADMTSRHLLAALTALLAIFLAAPAAATDSGGVPAQVFLDGHGGGVVAPGEPEPSTEPAGPPTAPPPVDAEAAQEETPTTPEGEEQPDGETPDGETPDEETPDDEGTPPGDDGADGGAPGEESAGGGFLPRTGFELAALTSIGLGLLLAGAALWPTSSWPPPARARPSRSTRR